MRFTFPTNGTCDLKSSPAPTKQMRHVESLSVRLTSCDLCQPRLRFSTMSGRQVSQGTTKLACTPELVWGKRLNALCDPMARSTKRYVPCVLVVRNPSIRQLEWLRTFDSK